VMLTDIEAMSERGRALLYVGMSRARLMVWVFANKRIKSEIRVLSRL
jgi:superfamily I DNA/RNA helicase